jgi:hypothetical protein
VDVAAHAAVVVLPLRVADVAEGAARKQRPKAAVVAAVAAKKQPPKVAAVAVVAARKRLRDTVHTSVITTKRIPTFGILLA